MLYILLCKVKSKGFGDMKLLKSIGQSFAYFMVVILISLPFIVWWAEYSKARFPEIAGGPIEQLPIEIFTVGGAFLAIFIFGKFFKSVRIADLGLHRKNSGAFAVTGFLMGVTLIIAILGALYALDVLSINPDYRMNVTPQLIALVAGVTMNVIAQQIIVFGYMFTAIRKATTATIAVITISILFLVAHAGVFTQPWPVSGIASTNLFLAGLLLSMAHLRSGTLWLGIGFHTGWNLTQALANLLVTGHDIGVGVPPLFFAGPDILTGGDIGVEGSIIGIPAVILGIIIIVGFFRQRSNAERGQTSHER